MLEPRFVNVGVLLDYLYEMAERAGMSSRELRESRFQITMFTGEGQVVTDKGPAPGEVYWSQPLPAANLCITVDREYYGDGPALLHISVRDGARACDMCGGLADELVMEDGTVYHGCVDCMLSGRVA